MAGANLLQCGQLGLLLLLLLASEITGDTYYHLAKASQACKVSVHEQQHADVICRFYEDLSGENPCRVQRIQWKKVDVGAVLSVNDSVKYGVWEGIPGWGVSDGERLSLLRIRDVQYPDTGLYMCEITCQSKQGMKKYTRLAEVCMRQRVNNMAICQSEAPPSCFNTFRNGVCDRRCDNEEGMYDGFDCVPPVRDCSPIFNSYCTKHFDNSRCDPRCNSAGCSWDGGDCVTKGRGYVKGTVVLMVAHKPEALKKVLVQFLRSMSKLLRTIVRIRIEKHSHDGIRPWHTQATEPGASSPVHVRGSKVYLRLDNSNCHHRCFKSAEAAARFIAAAVKKGWDPGIPLFSVGVLERMDNQCSLENNTLLHADPSENMPTKEFLRSPYETIDNAPHEKTHAVTFGVDSWVLLASIVGGAAIFVFFVIILTVCQVKKYRGIERSNVQRTHVVEDEEKDSTGLGTHV